MPRPGSRPELFELHRPVPIEVLGGVLRRDDGTRHAGRPGSRRSINFHDVALRSDRESGESLLPRFSIVDIAVDLKGPYPARAAGRFWLIARRRCR